MRQPDVRACSRPLDAELISNRDTHRGAICATTRIFLSARAGPYRFHILLDADRAGGTYRAALSAAHAVSLCQILIKRRRHLHFGTAERKVQDTQP